MNPCTVSSNERRCWSRTRSASARLGVGSLAMKSRWAPASEPPNTTSSLWQSSSRVSMAHGSVASSRSDMKTVSSSSATEMSNITSIGSRPSSAAMSATLRPT